VKPLFSLLLVSACLAVSTVPAANGKPNFLFIISDDQAPTSIGALGDPEIKTPNLDRLVRRGTTFTHCFNQGSWSGAVCVASRTMLITGQTVYRAPQNKPYLDKWAYAKGPLAVEKEAAVKLWPEVFREAGYRTFLTGKWHNSDASVLQGFTDGKAVGTGFYNTFEVPGQKTKDNPGYYRPAPGNNRWTPWDARFHGHWTPTVKDITNEGGLSEGYRVEKHTSELYADAAVAYLRQGREKSSPFFMYVAFNAPHDPRQAPKKFVDQYPAKQMTLPPNYLPEHPFNNGAIKIRDEVLAPFPRTEDVIKVHRSEYNAIVTHMDREIGRILKALEESGQADNTYVIFTSDHGLAMGSHGLLGKQNPYDHSIRLPFLISGPGIPKNRRVDDLIYMQSVYPTTCELAGLEVPKSVEFSSIRQLATGESKRGGEATIYGTYLTFQRLVRTKTHKLVYYPKIDRHQLFDLVKDPGEMADLSADPAYAKVKQKLIKSLAQKRKQLGDGLPN
jgi:arylsulfatase A-like enzyme